MFQENSIVIPKRILELKNFRIHCLSRPCPQTPFFFYRREKLSPRSQLIHKRLRSVKASMKPYVSCFLFQCFLLYKISLTKNILSERHSKFALFGILELLFLFFKAICYSAIAFSCFLACAYPYYRCVLYLYHIMYST